ncbi:MAG: mandelate racemase/muconate lactonizing enzyme family protein [Planctomycetes bacterium]|nr:mandelate racemase/muconate lactonizing enzyme family protein [Planctomycetota bacterium]
MKIVRATATHFAAWPNITFLELTTDAGLTGLGETYYTPQTACAFLKEVLLPQLAGRDALQIEAFWRASYDASHVYGNRGVEMRCLSAVDVALWDLLGQHTKQPVWQLLGGTSHPAGVPVYNTCASEGYAQGTPGSPRSSATSPRTTPDDYGQWSEGDAGLLAQSLLDDGLRAMKIWPFDPFAPAANGQYISKPDLERGLRPFRQIRDAVGDKMEIILEGHGYWSLSAARTIAEALEPYRPALLEDLIRPDHAKTLAELRRSTKTPICASELVLTRYGVQALLDAEACDVVMTDATWTGGISEARKIGVLAEAHNRGVIFHDCTGPATLAASLHLAAHAPNTWMQEMVRAYTKGFYRELADHSFELKDGRLLPPSSPGLGLKLKESARRRPDATVQVLYERA